MLRVAMGAAAALLFFAPPVAAQSSPHRVEVELREGVAVVRETMRFPRAGALSETLQAHLPLPPGAVLRSLRVCAGTLCRRGRADPSLSEVFFAARPHHVRLGQAPLALASVSRDALHVHATQSVGSEPTTVTVEWAAPTSSAGALEYLALPLRYQITRSPRLEVSAPPHGAPSVHAPGELHTSQVVVGRRSAPTVTRSTPVHVAILVDVSPSTREHADALRRVTEATLRSLPSDTLVTVVSFASRAILVSDARPAADLLSSPTFDAYLPAGARARPSAAWALASESRLVDDVVWLGDGLVSGDAEELATLARIVDSGTRLHAFSVTSELSDVLQSAVARSHGVARRVAHERGRLVDAVLASMWTSMLPAPAHESASLARARAGLLRGQPHPLVAVHPADVGNARKYSDGGQTRFRAGGGISPSRVFRCGLRICPVEIRGSISRHLIRRAIQRSVTPRVRACFRAARAGRPGWSARVDARIVVIRGEVVAAEASGGGEPLDRCVQSAFDDLDLPAQDDPIIVNYPFVARPIALPAAEDLGVAAPELDALLTRFEEVPAVDAWPRDASFRLR